MAFIASIVFFIATVLMTFSLAGEFTMFIDVPSILLTFPGAIFFGLACTSWESCKLGIKLSISEQEGISTQDYQKAKDFFKITGNTAMHLGWLMTLLGWVAIGSNTEPEEFSRLIGPAFAVSMLTLVYAIILKVICYVAEQRILLSPPGDLALS